MRKIGIGLTAAVLIAAVAAPAWASQPLGNPPEHKVTICHATSSSNPVQFWEIITVDVASSGGRKKIEGHVGHSVYDPNNRGANNRGRFDVIPAFTYGGESFPGATDPGNPSDWNEWIALNPDGRDCGYAALNITKSVTDVDGGGPNASVDATNDVITYSITVENTGNVTLTGVTVTDTLDPTVTYVSGDDGDGLLEVDETWTYSATYTVKVEDLDSDQIENTAEADSDQTGPDTDNATVPVGIPS